MYKICGKNGRDGDETIQNKWHDKRLRNLRNYKRFFRFSSFLFCFRQRKAFACFGFLSEGSLLICVLLCFLFSIPLSFPLPFSLFHFVPGRQFIYGFAFIKKIFIHVFLFIFLRAALNLFCVTGCLPVCLCMCVCICVSVW